MNSKFMERKRIIDTFAAKDIQTPNIPNPVDSLSEYSLKEGYGLELRKRRRNRIKYLII